jgi:hypothetical protein
MSLFEFRTGYIIPQNRDFSNLNIHILICIKKGKAIPVTGHGGS